MPKTNNRQLGYDLDSLFQNGSAIGGLEIGDTPSSHNTFYDGVGAGAIVDGNFIANFQQVDGAIFSGKTTFNNTETGYRLGLDAGTAKFYIGDSTTYLNWTGSALVIVGSITATTGTIGGFTIGADYIRDAADSFGMASTVSGSDDVRFWAGDTFANRATADFKVTEAGAITASNISITGGSIAGTPINTIPNNTSTDISLLDMTHDLVFSVTDLNTVAWASGTITLSNGRTFSISSGNTGNMAARSYVYLDTAVSSTVLQVTTSVSTSMGANKKLIAVCQNQTAEASFTVYNGIGGIKLPESGTSISNNNWVFSGTWTLTDSNTVTWGSGTLTIANGNSYSITGAGTGNMTAKTYIYFALGTSSTAFQTTTTRSTAVGAGKILIAIAEDGADEPTLVVLNDDQFNIDAANIVAGSITANEIAAGTITATELNVSQLSAISADMGTLTAGTIGAGTATIGSWAIGATTIASPSDLSGIILDANGHRIVLMGTGNEEIILDADDASIKLGGDSDQGKIMVGAASAPATGNGVFIGTDGAGGFDFRAGDPAGSYIHYDDSANTFTVNGAAIQTSASNPRFVATATSFTGTDASGDVVFEVIINGADTGDVTMGDDATGSYAKWDNSAGTFNVFADNVPTTTQGFFGGDGSDGALAITSGTTTVSAGSAATLVKNYSSISITSTGKLAFSNPHTNGTTIILKSQGNVTITSTATCIDASAMGAAGGAAVVISSDTSQNGNVGSNGISDSSYITNRGAAGIPNDAGEVSGGAVASFSALKVTASMGKYSNIIPGAGGGSGGVLRSGGSTTVTSGAGGRGGGVLIIECGGAWNFTTASGISVAGAAGGNGSDGGAAAGSASAGGGGGGGGGICIVLYTTLTANSGTIVVAAASGGSGDQFGTDPDGGGSGAGSVESAGSNSSAGTGGNGGAGKSVVAQNTLFA